MAGKKAQYEDALSSVFDFIFKNSTKKGKGLKPPKPTGLSPSNDFVGALAEMAGQPAYYTSAGIMGLFDEAINQSLVEFYVDKKEGADKTGRFRVRPREVLTLLRNPSEYVNKVFADAKKERAWSKTNLGSYLDQAIGTYWANKKAGFSIGEAYRIGKAAGNVSDLDMENMVENMAGENSGVGYLIEEGKIDEARFFSEEVRRLGNSRFSHSKLSEILSRMPSLKREHIEEIIKRYGKKSYQLHRKDYLDSDFRASPTNYREHLQENLMYRYRIAVTDDEKEKNLKAYLAVGTWNRLKMTQGDMNFEKMWKDVDKAVVDMEGRRAVGRWGASDNLLYKQLIRSRDEIEKLRNKGRFGQNFKFNTFSDNYDYNKAKRALGLQFDVEIAQVRFKLRNKTDEWRTASSGGGGDPVDLRLQIEGLRDSLSMLLHQKGQLKSLPGRDFRVFIGNTFGAVDYIRSVGSGDFVRGLWNGSWFTKEVSGKDSAPGRFSKYKDTLIVVPKNELNPLYASLASVYYVTPPSILKTFLWNGELFGYRAWKNQQDMLRFFNNPRLVEKMRTSGLFTGDLAKIFKGNSIDEKEFFKQFDKFLGTVSTGGFGEFSSKAKRALNYHHIQEGRLKMFGGIERWYKSTRFYKRIFGDKGVNRRLMRFIGKQLFRLSEKPVWRRAVVLFTKGSIGIRQLVSAGIRAIAASMGVTFGGPIGAFVLAVLSDIATNVVFAVAKPLLKIAIILVLFVLLFIPMIATIFFGIFGIDSLTSAYRHVPPVEAAQCVEFNPHSGLYPEPPAETGTKYPPSNSTCPLNFSPQYCTQGHSENDSNYHQATKAIDIGTGSGTWTAPSDGGRVVSYVPVNICAPTGNNYGGVIKYDDGQGNIYTIMHAKAVVASGPVKKGQVVAVVETGLTSDKECWTGAHFHLHISAGGSYQDSYEWYNEKLGCSITACQ